MPMYFATRAARSGELLRYCEHHGRALGVPDDVDLVVAGLGHHIVEERVENGKMAGVAEMRSIAVTTFG